MTAYAFSCTRCGSANIRRSRQKSALEYAKTFLGEYPFRCFDCNNRFWVNVWRFSILPFAKCPRCLSVRIIDSPRHYRLNVWRKLLMTLGAHAYRCGVCRHEFLSFRRAVSVDADGWHPDASHDTDNVPGVKTGA